MNYYGKHEQEQAVAVFLHEHNRGLSALTSIEDDLRNWVNKNTELMKSMTAEQRQDLFKIESRIKSNKLLLRKFIDDYLRKWEKFPTPNQ